MDFVELIQTPKLENIVLHSQLSDGLSGTLVLTFSHLIFSSKNGSDYELWVDSNYIIISLINY